MKKNFPSLLVSTFCLATGLLLGCGGNDDPTPANCESKVNAYEAALNAYIADPVKSKCESFKSAAANLLDCPGITAAERAEYEDAVAGITCD